MNDDIYRRITDFFASFPAVRYPRNQILLFPGEDINKIFHVVDGRVCQYSISYRGDMIIVNTFKPPAFFPMAMVMNHTPSNFFYKTEADTIMRVAPAEEVISFLHAEPDVLYDLLSRVYFGVESVLQRMVLLMSGTAKSRLVFELIVEFRRFGNKAQNDGFLEISEASIASRSGLSRETVSREMRHLKAKGVVEIRSGKIFISDLTGLEEQLGAHM